MQHEDSGQEDYLVIKAFLQESWDSGSIPSFAGKFTTLGRTRKPLCFFSPLMLGRRQQASALLALFVGFSALALHKVLHDSCMQAVIQIWLLFSVCADWLMPLLLKDGPRSCGSGKEWWIQPALRHLGGRHNSHWARGTPATHVWSAPHEVCWQQSLLSFQILFSSSRSCYDTLQPSS